MQMPLMFSIKCKMLSNAPVRAPMVAFSVNSAPSSHLGTIVPSAASLSLRMPSPTHPEALQPCTLHVLTLKGLHRLVVLFVPTALRPHRFFRLPACDHAPHASSPRQMLDSGLEST